MSLNETGVVTITIGSGIFALGAVLLFDKALMIAGNLIIIIGFIMIMKHRTADLFKLQTIQGTITFIIGLICLFMNYAILGFLLEIIGLIFIFKGYIPDFKTILINLLFRSSGNKRS